MNIRVQMDHRIDLRHMQEALDQVLEIYPLLNNALVQDGDDLCLESCDEPLKVYTDENTVAPGSKKAYGRVFTVNCHDHVLSLCGMHSFFDAHGLLVLLYSLLIQYCSIHFGEAYHMYDDDLW
jgi:hypothetical protein